MKNYKNRFLFFSAVALFLALPLAAQLRINGYFSLDYLKGQDQSLFSRGSFQNASAGLMFSGDWAPNFSYALEVRFKENMRFEIEQAWAGWNASEALRVKIGLFLVPFGRYNLSNRPFQTGLAHAPYPIGENFPESWRDLGLLAEGKIGFLLYSAYIGNGLAQGEDLRPSQQFKDNNRDKGRGGRLGFLLSSELEVGLSYYSGKVDAANERNLSLQGADLRWANKDWSLIAEYSKSDIQNPAPLAKGKGEGYFVFLSLNFDNLVPFVAYEKYSASNPLPDAAAGGGWSVAPGLLGNYSRWVFGVAYSVHQNILLKFEYDINRESNLELRDNLFRVQAAVHF
jgi:hypothetical protein